jgi:class 3 adenylate cyclase/CHAT domain-containing protein/Tfp pilus assembly protein PilF
MDTAREQEEKQGFAKTDTAPESTKKPLEEILRERKELDRMLQTDYTRDVTLMFTDIVGSTSFFERRGDIEGRSMIQEHNDLLFPVVQRHRGTVLRTIGDAIMATFPTPEDGVRSAIEMQRTLCERNKSQNKEDLIRVRIGVNYGKGILQDGDVYGDMVNVAARVESLAAGDQILVSRSVYDQVRRTEDILCRYFSSTEVKGKAEPIEIYRVVWGEEETVVDKTRTGEISPAVVKRKARMVFQLEVSREQDKIKVSGHEKAEGEGRTLIHYDDAQVSSKEILECCTEVTSLLNQANNQGKVSKDILVNLQHAGKRLYEGLLTEKAREQLAATKAEDLVVDMDDQLVHIPWELLYDGTQFLCQRFSMGRLVKTRQTLEGVKTRRVALPLKMLIISNPRQDLPRAHQEGLQLAAQADREEGLITANHKTDHVAVEEVTKSLPHYDLVHFAGHADYDLNDPSQSGWLLTDGKISSKAIKESAETASMPALVFSNACHSGQTVEWSIDAQFENKIYGLANAFLISGVQHYIGTFWAIQDEAGSLFAFEFYNRLLQGNTVGDAVRQAREALIRKYGEDTIVWASYMLYGDPTYRYFDREDSAVEKKAPGKRAEEEAAFPAPAPGLSRRAVAAMVIGGVLLSAIVLGGIFHLTGKGVPLPKDPVEKAYVALHSGNIGEAEQQFTQLSQGTGEEKARGYEGLAALWFQRGDYQKAQDLCAQVLSADPENVYAQVLTGNIAFNQGSVEEAISAYEAAAKAAHGSPWQKSEAYNRLGRIYAEQNKPEEALSSYDQAINLNPSQLEAYSNKGVVLAGMGKTEEAIGSYQRALKSNPKDTLTTVLLNQLLNEKQSAADTARQDRIDRLVTELVARYKNQSQEPKTAFSADSWTSRPLSVSFLAFGNRGALATRAGENEYLALALTQALQAQQRVSVVERELIDKLLEELNLSASELANPETALKLGKIIGARFITTGTVTRLGKETQVSLRVIETETSLIKGAFVDTIAQENGLTPVASSLAVKLAETLRQQFPLQGKVASIQDDSVTLNIGAALGVTVGLKMKVFDEGEPIVMEGRDLGRKKIEVAEIEITSVEAGMSVGRVVNKSAEVKKGQKAIELSLPQPPGPVTGAA